MKDQDPLPLEIDPKQQIFMVLGLLKSNWFTIFTLTGSGLLVGIALFFFLPKEYRSESRLMMKNSFISDQDHVSALTKLDVQRRSKLLEAELTSPEWVIEVLDLLEWPEWVQARSAGDTGASNFVDRVRDKLVATVTPGEGGEKVIEIAFEWSDARRARDFNQQIRDMWLRKLEEEYRNDLSMLIEADSAILEGKENKLNQARIDMERVERRYGVIHSAAGRAVDRSRESDLESQLDQLETSLVEVRLQADEIDLELGERGPDDELLYPPTVDQINFSDDPEIVARIDEIEQIMAELDEYAALSYTRKHHKVRSAVQRLYAKMLEYEEFSQQAGHVVDIEQKPNSEYTKRKEELDRLNRLIRARSDSRKFVIQKLERIQEQNSKLPIIYNELDQLAAEVENQRYLLLDHKQKTQHLHDRATILQLQGGTGRLIPHDILAEPSLAKEATASTGWMALGMSVFIGLGIAVVMIASRELLKTSFSTAEQARRALRLPVLGESAAIQTELERRRARLQRALQVAASLTLLAGLGAAIYVCLAHPELLPLELRQWASNLRDGLV